MNLFSKCFRLIFLLFEVVLDCFLVASLVSSLFKFFLVCVVAVLGCAWPSWLFYFAFWGHG